MFKPEVIYQRSAAGRDEIYQKKAGLTQSERQVLIMVDGITTAGAIVEKLSSLKMERVHRALRTLQSKDLILEVFLPLEQQAADEVEREVVDRFLQQDPMDPVTIMSYDPEDEFGEVGAEPAEDGALNSQLPGGKTGEAKPSEPAIPELTVPELHLSLPTSETTSADAVPPEARQPVLDDALIAQLDMLAAEVRAARRAVESGPGPGSVPPPPDATQATPAPAAPAPAAARLHWGYWLILLGLACIGSYLLGRLH